MSAAGCLAAAWLGCVAAWLWAVAACGLAALPERGSVALEVGAHPNASVTAGRHGVCGAWNEVVEGRSSPVVKGRAREG